MVKTLFFRQDHLNLRSFSALPRPIWTKMAHFNQLWPEEVHFGPFRSTKQPTTAKIIAKNNSLEIWIDCAPHMQCFKEFHVKIVLVRERCFNGGQVANLYVWAHSNVPWIVLLSNSLRCNTSKSMAPHQKSCSHGRACLVTRPC